MSRFAQIDLSQLPPPDVVEEIDFEVALASVISQLEQDVPDLANVLSLESDPLRKLLETIVYRDILFRARVNDAARAVMLATASSADLDNLAALLGVARLTITPADESVTPSNPAVLETDDAFRERAQLALEGYTTAGSIGAYEFHARSADGGVSDVSVTSPAPGEVLVTVLAHDGDGIPPIDLIATVDAAVSADEVRPLCDHVTVAAPQLVDFSVEAQIEIATGPNAGVVLSAAQAAVDAYVAETRALGATVALSGLLRALHQAGVISAQLTSPAADVETSETEAPNCTGISIVQAVA
ncbi:MAG: baseplate J/gp47 family protein [Rhodobacteraceae bacterium]|nr:baseplate J/gp47 family protein [Paracoccaceae bacterium]